LINAFNYYSTDGVFAVTLKADEASPFKPQSDEKKQPTKRRLIKRRKTTRKLLTRNPATRSRTNRKRRRKTKKKPERVNRFKLTGRHQLARRGPCRSARILNNLAARKDKFFYISTRKEARQFGHRRPRLKKYSSRLRRDQARRQKCCSKVLTATTSTRKAKKVIYKAGPRLRIG